MALVGGIDLGATRLRAGVQDGDGPVSYYERRTASLTSMEDLLEWLATIASCLDKVVIAAAGRLQSDGKIRLTNVGWPLYTPCELAKILNDVQCAVRAMSLLDVDEYCQLNDIEPSTEDRVAVTISTGINSSLYKAGRADAAETGHTVWQPWEDICTADLSYQFLNFLQKQQRGQPVTVEDAISGHRGFHNLYNFMRQHFTPSRTLVEQVTYCRSQQEGIGSVITAAACQGDQFSLTCMKLWGGILGQYLRTIVLADLPQGGTIWLYGGIVESDDVMKLVLEQTSFFTHLIGGQAKMHELMEQISLRLVLCDPENIPLTVRGALQLAKEA